MRAPTSAKRVDARPGLMLTFGLVAALAMTSCTEAPTRGRTPELIQPLTKHMVARERYRELFEEWSAYTRAHPRDPLGWVQLAKAGNYSGAPCADIVHAAEKAVALAPNDAGALAVLGSFKWSTYCDGEPVDPRPSIRLLERALSLDPTLDELRTRLWVMRGSLGQKAAADSELVAVLDRGGMPDPLVDYGWNLLVGVEPDAILITNGDNDTCPLLALQAGRGFRTDVAVVNLSMLNLGWYRRALREGSLKVPVPLIDQSPAAKGGSDEAVRQIVETVAREGWKRPLYVACTVPTADALIAAPLSLEGLVYHVVPGRDGEMRVDADRIAQNLGHVYRLESATSPALDWKAWSSLSTLMLNYSAADLQLALARVRAGDIAGARPSWNRALELSTFHQNSYAQQILDEWSRHDAGSPQLQEWKRRLQGKRGA